MTSGCTPKCLIDEPCCAKAFGLMPSLGGRSAYFDNCKGILALCTIIGHTFAWLPKQTLTSCLPGHLVSGLWIVIKLLGVPGFSLVSGYLSTDVPGRKQLVGTLRLLATWFIMQFMWMAFMFLKSHLTAVQQRYEGHPGSSGKSPRGAGSGNGTYVGHAGVSGVASLAPLGWLPVPLFNIWGIHWYLLANVFWRLSLPVLARLHYPVAWSLLCSLAMLFSDASSLTSVQLTFSFWPFFLLGFWLKGADSWLERCRGQRWVAWAFSTGVLLIVASAAFVPSSDLIENGRNCLYGGNVRDIFFFMREHPETKGLVLRAMWTKLAFPQSTECMTFFGVGFVIVYYVFAAIGLAGLMGAVPEKPIFLLTKAGENGIYIYLMQIWFLMPISMLYGQFGSTWDVVLGLVSCIVVYSLLACGWTHFLCKPFVEPPVDCCLLSADAELPRPCGTNL
eukprot:TRINITY_DN6893_c1_g1_i1.p1 TRINITY_DN6893_c1_g1~~TRINITY_DN6893_c1_g1_i1.p1  ORF type:complete len:484 (-),score=39.42 TRINITY_DN6893_c1_g1_i1:364-1707(-)